MKTKHLLHPELHPVLEFASDVTLSRENLTEIRMLFSAGFPPLDNAEKSGVIRKEVEILDASGYAIRCLLYTPVVEMTDKPAYLHIHGGGLVMGLPEMSDHRNIALCAALHCVVVSVDYRLAPEHPAPTPLEDCHAALAWLFDSAEYLGVNPQKVAVGGESAGGGLAASLALKVRDEGKYKICHQHLTYPMLDDRTGTNDFPGDPLVGEFVWTREFNRFGWNAYLGDTVASATHVPARALNFSELPSTWLLTGGLDLFRDENIKYAMDLMKAGVATDLSVYPSACHGFQVLPEGSLTKRYERDHLEGLRSGFLSYPE